MSLQQRRGEVALQRCKPEAIVGVAFQNKLIQAIAKTTNAVVKHYRVGSRNMHSLEFEGFDETIEGLSPMTDSFFRADQFGKIKAFWSFDNRAA